MLIDTIALFSFFRKFYEAYLNITYGKGLLGKFPQSSKTQEYLGISALICTLENGLAVRSLSGYI